MAVALPDGLPQGALALSGSAKSPEAAGAVDATAEADFKKVPKANVVVAAEVQDHLLTQAASVKSEDHMIAKEDPALLAAAGVRDAMMAGVVTVKGEDGGSFKVERAAKVLAEVGVKKEPKTDGAIVAGNWVAESPSTAMAAAPHHPPTATAATVTRAATNDSGALPPAARDEVVAALAHSPAPGAAAKAAWASGDPPEAVAAGLLGLYQKMGAG